MRFLLFVGSMLVSMFAVAQETKMIFQEPVVGLKEEFSVRLSDTTIRENAYKSTLNGIIFSEGQYKEGERTGLWKFYDYQSGKLEYAYDYSKKQFEGLYMSYDDGKLVFSVNYQNGKREGEQRTYYSKGGLLDMWLFKEGIAEGKRSHYFEDGALNFELNYTNGNLDGICTFYHQHNKQILLEVVYSEGKLMNIKSMSDSTGKALSPGTVKDGNGLRNIYFNNNQLHYTFEYQNGVLNGKFTEYRDDNTLFIRGNYSNNEPSGIWKFYSPNRKEYCTYDFEKDVMIRENKDLRSRMLNYDESRLIELTGIKKTKQGSVEINPNLTGNERPIITFKKKGISTEELSVNLETEAKFPGGTTKLVTYLQENITYPTYERENYLYGLVIIGFVVEKDGSITNIKPLKEVKYGEGLTKEAKRVIANMPRWTPGMIDGRPVRVGCTVPIRFSFK